VDILLSIQHKEIQLFQAKKKQFTDYIT